MKKYAERSEAKKNTEKLKEGLKSSILGPQNLRSGGPGPLGPPPGSASAIKVQLNERPREVFQQKTQLVTQAFFSLPLHRISDVTTLTNICMHVFTTCQQSCGKVIFSVSLSLVGDDAPT